MKQGKNKIKILFFGIGVTTEILEERLRINCDVIGYTDSRSAIVTYKRKKYYPLGEINNLAFDYIVISTDNTKLALKIADMLEKEYQISNDKILPYYVYANHELYSILLNADKGNEYECMIFGNSHARDGILTKYLNVSAINFSTSSQDIYGNYKTFQKIIKEYEYKCSKLKYIIIDLYDYNILNYDTSLTSEIFNYIYSNGIIDKHNFEHNTNYRKGVKFEEQLLDYLGLICDSQKSKIIDKIFKINEGNIEKSITTSYTNRNSIRKDEPLQKEKMIGSLVAKRFENTIKENKALLIEFIKDIRGFNPNIKIIFTLIPRYITMEKVCEPFMVSWKEELYEFLNYLNSEYDTSFFDMKSNTSISGNNYFYKDIYHLNTTGGICLTTIINEYIYHLEQ